MSKIKLLSIAVIGLLGINVVIVGFLLMKKPPGQMEGRPPKSKENLKQVIIERLNFDPEQVVAYEKLIATHQSAIRTLEDSIKLLKNDLYQTLTDVSFAGKDTIVNRLSVFQKQIELSNYEHFTALKKLCHTDQLEKFNKLTKELARFFAPGKKGPPPPKD